MARTATTRKTAQIAVSIGSGEMPAATNANCGWTATAPAATVRGHSFGPNSRPASTQVMAIVSRYSGRFISRIANRRSKKSPFQAAP